MGQEFDDDGVVCGNGDPENEDQAIAIQDAFTEEVTGASHAEEVTRASSAGEVTGASSGHFTLLTTAQQATASSVFGTSLDFGGVYLSDFVGVENRSFTIAFAASALLSAILGLPSYYIINCGKFDPAMPILIHELTHVWQSQHHRDRVQYVQNSLASQAIAKVRNVSVGSSANLFPFSPYAYIPGKAFSEYAAEQIAKQVEKGVAPIVAHTANVAVNVRDTDNETGLATERCENKTSADVQF
jgi:hypothetical protein